MTDCPSEICGPCGPGVCLVVCFPRFDLGLTWPTLRFRCGPMWAKWARWIAAGSARRSRKPQPTSVVGQFGLVDPLENQFVGQGKPRKTSHRTPIWPTWPTFWEDSLSLHTRAEREPKANLACD
jgi:hypothetical protein